MPLLSRTLPFAPTPQHPPFVGGSPFAPLDTPFRAPIAVSHRGPGELTLSTRLSVASGTQKLLASWQVASDPCFQRLERHGLRLVEHPDREELTIALRALEPGRPYWARLWAAGSWSAAVHLRTRSHARTLPRSRECASLECTSRECATHGAPSRVAQLMSVR